MLPEEETPEEITDAEEADGATPEETQEEEAAVVETSGEDLNDTFSEDPDDLDAGEEKVETPDAKTEGEEEEETPAEAKDEAEKGKGAEDGEEAEPAPKPDKAEAKPEEKTPETPKTPDEGKPEGEGEPVVTPQQPDLAAIHEKFTEWRGESEKLLAEHHYNISEEQAEELREDGVSEKLIEQIPGMMSRVYLDAVTMAMGQITTNLPQLIKLVNDQQATEDRDTKAFFDKWPQLREHEDVVRSMGQAHRQVNPKLTREEFINQVGAAAMVSLQLPIDGEAKAEEEEPKAEPFKPGSTGTPASGPKPKLGEFEQMDAELFGEDELDT